MITQAKIKNVIADFSGVSAAYHGYQDRYRAIPATTQRGHALGLDDHPVPVKGDGQRHRVGHLQQRRATCTPAVEACSWWDHLRKAGFVSGNWRAAALQRAHRPDRRANGRRGGRAGPTLLNVAAATASSG